MIAKIRVAILDDHQSIIDGYRYRLASSTDIEVVATALYGEDLVALLAQYPVDVLLLDVSVPTSQDNPSPYPILRLIPELLQIYPNLSVLVISVYTQRTLIRAVMEAGGNGYILKDDHAAIEDLASIVHSVANGGVFLSQRSSQLLLNHLSNDPLLTQRQMEALSLCAAYPEARISDLAKRIPVANSTMRNLLSEAYLRLGVTSRAAAVAKARKMGLITPLDPQYEG
jgi:DNA-binding NarL/FixJ family response regulator